MSVSRKSQVLVVIPARWQATRFPGKVLARVDGRPLLEHIIQTCQRSGAVDAVIVATDDRRIRDVAANAGAEAVMTPRSVKSGSDRAAIIARNRRADIIINVQGDEYFTRPQLLGSLVHCLNTHPDAHVATLIRPVDAREADNPHLVKVVCDRNGRALYFSRSPIPYYRDSKQDTFYGHIGIYAYRRPILLQFTKLRPTPLEKAENLEQLRLLEHGYQIFCVKTSNRTVGVDTPADLRHLQNVLTKNRLHLRGDREQR